MEPTPTRPSGRRPDEMRAVSFETGLSKHAEGSCLVRFGDTHVLCLASLSTAVPRFLKGMGQGWVTAEYGMLPRATNERTRREAAQGRQSGRSLEIQRLIGRSLRAVTLMKEMGEFTITVDCDVIQADGGTRTASISGGYVALRQCFAHMRRTGLIQTIPIREEVAGVSCGLYRGTALLDLDYAEDSAAEADTNFVLTASGGIVEIQGTAEAEPFSEQSFQDLLVLARSGVEQITARQREACPD